ncbi:ABC transporter ATP-binding protein [Candidatus Desantisbacteria bacterium CG_4_10_14_0_8_um_filter_48_22]|uniref:ABC transporter ATP-binding protein n=1 Tax=Candidatus Desantisbacteria bacterium CG_4_10_14_0_8_um_filter_48_22 TaxID=1974543 RepID=A0A2M7SFM8_9BACT|nr:MAG: ABC transporter ATP-binding protein [Candidatus Desantisbacteria bacterium CG02_land_8_20_14_3_00_49_13]PIZ18310.1 MAG: ABC transporter ATP-binding protein [Candidatus Desantisbacteria bacterium CG_4_10_14_0_8_um_filter_48_22]
MAEKTGFRIMKYIKPYWPQLLGAFGCTVIAAVSILLLPGLFQNLTIHMKLRDFKYLGIFFRQGMALLFLRFISLYGQTYFNAYVCQRAITDLRNGIYEHLLKMSFSFHAKWRTGELISRTVSDIDIIQNVLLHNFSNLLLYVLMSLGLTLKMFDLNWRLALIIGAVAPVVGFAMSWFGERIKRITSIVQAKVADISSLIQETISGIRTVKAFSREEHEIGRFNKENERNFLTSMKRARVEAIQEPVVEVLAFLGILVVVWYGARCMMNGTMDLSRAVAFVTVILFIREPVVGFSRAYSQWQQAFVSSNRVFEILDKSVETIEKSGPVKIPSIKGAIKMEGVSFHYEEGKTVLSDISLDIMPGEIIALVGPVGAGKSTLTSLIPRFYDPASGLIAIDGYDLRSVDIISLRQQIGIVPQEVVLFNRTIKENIAYGKVNASEEEILHAAESANALDFIMRFSGGFDTHIGERGIKLSGGQRQCLAVARVILKNPRIILLDEATSSMDSESESLVQVAMARLIEGRTTIIIAHRLSTVRHADRIVVMDSGRIVETGKHAELMAGKGLYYKLYQTQFKPLEEGMEQKG